MGRVFAGEAAPQGQPQDRARVQPQGTARDDGSAPLGAAPLGAEDLELVAARLVEGGIDGRPAAAVLVSRRRGRDSHDFSGSGVISGGPVWTTTTGDYPKDVRVRRALRGLAGLPTGWAAAARHQGRWRPLLGSVAPSARQRRPKSDVFEPSPVDPDVVGLEVVDPDVVHQVGDLGEPVEGDSVAVAVGGGPGRVCLLVVIDEERRWSEKEVVRLEDVAALCAAALAPRRFEEVTSGASAESWQRAQLTALPQPDHLQLLARYRPASAVDQVGGDWYDAVIDETGVTSLVVGDVIGHDLEAAAVMGQMRSMSRTLLWSHRESPAWVLGRLDASLPALKVDGAASCLVARIEQGQAEAARSARVLRWSSAGHPPALVVDPDGTTRFLARDDGGHDLMLGFVPEAPRHDGVDTLEAGSTLLLYTDGLVERRGESLQTGLQRLAATAARLIELDLERWADALLAEMHDTSVGGHDDDVVLLAVRMHPEDRPRPAEAGPSHG